MSLGFFFSRYSIILIGCIILNNLPLNAAPLPEVPIPIHEAFVSKSSDPTPPSIINIPPPAPVPENIPPQPSNSVIWIPGYWAWVPEKGDYLWVCGVWRRQPPNQTWIPGKWIPLQGGYAWVHGFWSPLPTERLALIQQTPPPRAEENVPPSPGNNYFWIPGYWEYSNATQQFSWVGGKWEPFNSTWVLVPATYYWRETGYAFSPMYWDWQLDARGSAYSCTLPNASVPLTPDVIIQNLYFCYPDYTLFYWNWWYFHPGWWDDCWCMPPWWFWPEWWTFGWVDMWELWWWWGHPGFPAPWWMSLELSQKIAPPSDKLIDLLKKLKTPDFIHPKGKTDLLPSGKDSLKEPIAKPLFPDAPDTQGIVTPPTLPPGKQIDVPKPPPVPDATPPTRYPPSVPPSYIPPQYNPPPPQGDINVYPSYPVPETPPGYYPPRRPHWPPGQWNDHDGPHYPPGGPRRPPNTDTGPQGGKNPPGNTQPPDGGKGGRTPPSSNYIPPTQTPNRNWNPPQGGNRGPTIMPNQTPSTSPNMYKSTNPSQGNQPTRNRY